MKTGPLESLKKKTHCEMCGAVEHKTKAARLEPAFDPSGQAKTLCFDCRIGSAELLAAQRAKLLSLTQKIGGLYKDEIDHDTEINGGDAVDILVKLIRQARRFI